MYYAHKSADNAHYAHYNINMERRDARIKFREVEKLLLKDGWYQVKQKGSHHQYKHPTKTGKVTIPEHGGDLNVDTVKSIMRQAGI